MPDNDDVVKATTLYYERVDSGDIPGLLDLFAADAVYHRPGYPPMVGQAELERFYRKDRVIADGRHAVRSLVTQGPSVAVHGTFAGTLKDGTAVDLRFADFFTVGDDGRFTRRDTFFFSPAV